MEKEAKKLFKSTKEKLSKAKRSFVCKSLRDCKTAAEERAFVKKESAHIRDLFREEDVAFRRQNVLKLLFFHMNGYPTNWGKIECLKLCTSSKYKDKRVGYLGLMVLLDERDEILMMMTNCLKQDLSSSDVKVAALALTAVGNVATPEMLRDLLPEITKQLEVGTPYVRKKANLIALRAVRKVPEFAEDFTPLLGKLLAVRNGAVLLTTTTLLMEIVKSNPDLLPELRSQALPPLMEVLRELNTAGFDPDLTIGGITDPFMQVRALQAISLLARGDRSASDSVADLLTQVVSNTDMSKNAGTAVVVECIRTIYKLEAPPPQLTSLALTNLGKFLVAKEPNSRYVALVELSSIFRLDPAGVKQHTGTIVECLHEPDPSIRHRAVELLFAIADEANIAELTEESLAYLEDCDNDVKEDTCTRLIEMVDRLGPTVHWKVDIFVRVLESSDSYVREEILDAYAAVIAGTPDVQAYAAEKLFRGLMERKSVPAAEKRPLSKLDRFALYIYGEYGHLVTGSGGPIPVDSALQCLAAVLKESTESVVTNEMERAQWDALVAYRQVGLSSVAKLLTKLVATGKVGDENILEARGLISAWRQAGDAETQQRACEYSTLLTTDLEQVRPKVFEPVPPGDLEAVRKRAIKTASINSSALVQLPGSTDLISFLDDDQAPAPAGAGAPAAPDPLADILGLSAALPAPPKKAPEALPSSMDVLGLPAPATAAPTKGASDGMASLLDDVLGPSAPAGAGAKPLAMPALAPAAAPAPVPRPAHTPAAAAPGPNDVGPIQLFDKDGVKASLVLHRTGTSPQTETRAVATFVNKSPVPVQRIVCLLSVPKYMKLNMHAASATSLQPGGGEATQRITLTNTAAGTRPIQLRYRIEFQKEGGQPQQEQGSVANIPADL